MDEMDVSDSISFEVSVQTTVRKLHMELDKPANLHTEPSGGQPRTLTSGAPIPDGAASPAQTQMPSHGRDATYRKLDLLLFFLSFFHNNITKLNLNSV